MARVGKASKKKTSESEQVENLEWIESSESSENHEDPISADADADDVEAADENAPNTEADAEADEDNLDADTADTATTTYRFRLPVEHFTGREPALARLASALHQQAQDGATVIIRGPGGVGKTELAYALAEHLEDALSDDHILLELHGTGASPLPPARALQQIIHTFEPQAQLSDNLDRLQEHYQAALREHRVLIVADDARDTAQVERLIPPPGSVLVVTTRHPIDLSQATTNTTIEDLEPLEADEAEQLVRTLCERAGEAAPRLADLCERLPLSLCIAAGMLAHRDDEDVGGYLETLAARQQQQEQAHEEQARAQEEGAGEEQAQDDAPEQAPTSQSIPPLAEEAVSPSHPLPQPGGGQVGGLNDNAILQSNRYDRIPPRLEGLLFHTYERLISEEQTTLRHLSVFLSGFDLESAMAVVNLQDAQRARKKEKDREKEKGGKKGSKKGGKKGDQGGDMPDTATAPPPKSRGRSAPPSVEQMLETLSRCHLLLYDPNEHRYTMHPLVQHFATARLSEDERSVFLRHAKHYATVAEEVEQFYQMGDEHLFEGLKMFDRERFNIDTGWSRAREWGDDDLMLRYSIVLGFTGMLRYDLRNEYLPRAQETLEIAQRLRRRDNEAHALNDLGYAYNILGELEEAVDLFTRALRILRTSHNLKRKVKKEGSILSNLGQAYIRIGNTPKAIEQSKLRIELAQASNDWRGEGIGLNNLGLACADLGKIEQAIAYFQKSLDLSRKYGDRNSEATDLGNLGRAYVDMGEIEQAVDLCEQALDIKWELGNSRDEGYALHFLGVARAAAGETERAREHQQQALTLAYEVGDRWLEARVINSMGEMSLAAGKQATAIEQFEQALDIARTTGDRRGVALAGWNLGRALEQQGTLSPTQAERVVELLQERVSYEQSIGHTEAEAHAETLAQVCERLGVAPPAPATTQNSE